MDQSNNSQNLMTASAISFIIAVITILVSICFMGTEFGLFCKHIFVVASAVGFGLIMIAEK